MEQPEKCHSWGKSEMRLSEGPGRVVGPIARNIRGIYAPLPDDFTFWVCTTCNCRQLTPEIEKALLQVEAEYLARPPTQR